MDKKEKERERRKQKRLEKLGSNHPVCTGCGEEDWRCLIANDDSGIVKCRECKIEEQYPSTSEIRTPACLISGKSNPKVLEDHHMAGKAYDDFCIPLSLNNHDKLSDSQKEHPRQIGKTPTDLERIGHFLLGLADFFVLLAKKLAEFGHLLIEKAMASSMAGGAK